MNTTLDTLRDALLLTLIVILMYIMYKRLLRILGKDKASRPRASLLDSTDQFDKEGLRVKFNLPEPASIEIKVFRNDEPTAIEQFQQNFEAGDHEVLLSSKLFRDSGKYSYSFQTEGCRYYRVLRLKVDWKQLV